MAIMKEKYHVEDYGGGKFYVEDAEGGDSTGPFSSMAVAQKEADGRNGRVQNGRSKALEAINNMAAKVGVKLGNVSKSDADAVVEEGKKARSDGKSTRDNPYPNPSRPYSLWLTGFMSGTKGSLV